MTIESINYHLEQGKEVETAIIDGASQIVVPAFVSLLCICIVFIPMFFLSGVARFLFVPMAESVMFAMVFSFLLSRTLVPTMAKYLLRMHVAHVDEHGDGHEPPRRRTRWCAFSAASRRASCGCAPAITTCWRSPSSIGGCSSPAFSASSPLSFLLAPFLGRNFFPQVDGGQILLHVRAPVGMRIEETAARFADVEKAIREVIPPAESGGDRRQHRHVSVVDQYHLQQHRHDRRVGRRHPDLAQRRSTRRPPTMSLACASELPRRFPGMTFSFLPADIVSQILNFGAPAPIDLQVRGNDLGADFAYANKLLAQIRHVTGVADARIQQSAALPTLDVNIDRTRAQYTGVTAADVTNSLVVNLASSQSGRADLLAEREERRHLSDRAADAAIPDRHAAGAAESADQRHRRADHGARRHRRHPSHAQRCGGLAVRHLAPMVEIYATTQGRDLGAVSARHPRHHGRATTRTSRRARSSPWSARRRP